MATGYGLDGRGMEFGSRKRKIFVLLSTAFRPILWATQANTQLILRTISLG
jgi:hypothetical protein